MTLKAKLATALQWRIRKCSLAYDRFTVRLGGAWFIRLHWPWPLRKPYQRQHLRLRAPGAGIGDELMCTPVFREIKHRNPFCQITFLTHYPELHADNPYVDKLEIITTDHDQAFLQLRYQHAVPPSRPIITLMGECVGLQFRADKTECTVPPVKDDFKSELERLPRPLIVIQTCASQWTPNKNWPTADWKELVDLLAATRVMVVEVGTATCLHPEPRTEFYRSFVGQTTVAELVKLICRADVFVGPVSGGMHIANACNIPSVIIYGGYESPDGHRHPNVHAFYSPVECAPCWLRERCPYDLKCMKMITPDMVYNAIHEQLHTAAPLQS
jgi:ADP-heptose:LPS heptosyltransferase